MPKKPTVLIVEDQKDISAILSKLVRKIGCEAVIAEDGASALELARELRPDLMLLDLMIPNRSGFEVCMELKGDPGSNKIPIFILTAATRGPKEEEEWRARCGADAFFSKPVERELLLNALRKTLNLL